MAAIYTERIVKDLMIRKGKAFWTNLTSGLCVVFFLVEWLLMLWAFKLEEQDIERFKRWLKLLGANLWGLSAMHSPG